ncbi:MAG: UvrD-helicase domain-containing protein [Akkermansia sp.]
MPTITNTLIAASAGTGKTYQLSLRFLSLLALGESPEKMIAVTFTRKAAGEFADRILNDLAKGASSDAGAASLAENITRALEGDDNMPGICPGLPSSFGATLTRERFLALLRLLVEHLSRLNLNTIDSLFAKMASTLTYELGISTFRIIDTVTEQRGKKNALLEFYRQCATDPVLSKRFSDIFLQGIKNDAESFNMSASMDALIKNYHELFLDFPNPEQWGNPVMMGIPPEEFKPIIPKEQFINEVFSLIKTTQELQENQAPSTKKEEKALDAYLSLLNKFADYPVTHYIDLGSKSIEKWRTTCEDYWPPVMDELVQSWLAMETQQACTRSKAAYVLIAEFEKRYRQAVRDRGQFLFHDVTRLLKKSLPADIRMNLEYRTNCAYSHWMLDEFQDTSHSQWNILQPFLQEIAEDDSGTNSLFIVGDVKQSIYQWRGGDPSLFRQLETHEPWQTSLQKVGMNTSYRSSQTVLDFVNVVCDFKRTATLSHPEACKLWGDFIPHQTARHDLTGTAQIWQASPQASDQDNDLTKVQAIYQVVADILRETTPIQHGKTCAILVSSNKQALDLKNWLDTQPDHFSVEVCEDAHVGIDSPLGKNLLHFFRWLLTPGDQFMLGLLLNSPLEPLTRREQERHSSWKSWKLQLEQEGYASVMRDIATSLSQTDLLTTFQQKRLNVWVEEAEEFDNAEGTLPDWIEHIQGMTRRENPSDDLIRIMTIHKSKGLEFDQVILPLTDKNSFINKKHITSFSKKDAQGKLQGILLAPNKYILENQASFQKLINEWEIEQQYEGFCKLYVALTRAVHATYVIIPSGKSSSLAESMRSIINTVANNLTHHDDPPLKLPKSTATCLYYLGDPLWIQQFSTKQTNQTQEQGKVTDKNIPPHLPPPPTRLMRKSPSRSEESQTATSKGRRGEKPTYPLHANNTPSLTDSAALGTEVHRVFQRISWWDPQQTPDWAQSPRTQAEKVVSACMQTPVIRELFICRPDTRVMREQNVEAIIGSHWISGSIDRLLLTPNSAHIIDFKTDHVASGEELVERHSAQMQSYRAIIRQITHLPDEAIQVTLVSTTLKNTFSA